MVNRLQEYAADRIYMNSVDTGWINDENPLDIASRTAEVSRQLNWTKRLFVEK